MSTDSPSGAPRARPIALTIAGSDSGGGAGIQADLKTFHAFGVFGTSALTAVTAQNTLGVERVRVLDPGLVRDQIRVVCEDLPPAAAKTGMLATSELIDTVAAAVDEYRIAPLVVDPVMVATSGDRLLEEAAVATLRDRLLPRATIVTPNAPEAALLTGLEVADLEGLRAAARALVDAGAGAALLKGGHLPAEEVVDLYWDGRTERVWRVPRIDTRHTHGTGCTLSAAITAGLARGLPDLVAVAAALEFTRRGLRAAPGLGSGRGPLDHGVL